MGRLLPVPHPCSRFESWALPLACLALPLLASTSAALDPRGHQFLALTDLSNFVPAPGSGSNQTVLTSPVISSKMRFNELIVSWNASTPDGAGIQLEARALGESNITKFYCLGLWSPNPEKFPRESVLRQKDDDGNVDTDTLILNRHYERFQLRLTLTSSGDSKPVLNFLGISITDNQVQPAPLPPNHKAWGKTLPVPERSQMAYEGGNVLCSPTTVSMILAYWSERLRKPDLDRDVPVIAAAVYDRNWHGTGNWPFNTAYAGSLPGLRAYVTRLSDLAELEDFVAAGLPVGLSLCYDLLRGRPSKSSGHLVVCVGFTKDGDPVINDPGTRQNVRKIFPRENLVKAWAYSKNAAYLIYPEKARLPKDRFGHWDSADSRRRFSFSTAAGKPPP